MYETLQVRKHCPQCPPYKPASLSIHLGRGVFYCFRCGYKGRSDEMRQILEWDRGVPPPIELTVPSEFVPLDPYSLRHFRPLRYLRKRGVDTSQIVKFKMGWCSSGIYSQRVIVPIYSGKKVAYFVARSIKKGEPKKYLNPPVAKGGFIFKTFHGKAPIACVVEGVFDAISVDRVMPAIALLSKNITPKQLREITESASRVIVMLDSDAAKESLALAYRLSYSVPVRNIFLRRGDPGSMAKPEIETCVRRYL